jgi:hypothetical protein
MDMRDGTFKQVTTEEKEAVEVMYEKANQDFLYRETRPRVKRISFFEVGEEVEIKESRFRVQSIGDNCLVLRLLPQKKD